MTSEATTPGHKAPCPQCGKPASGKFCQHCGSALGSRSCPKCGAKLSGAAKFCTQCGTPATPGAARPGGGASRAGRPPAPTPGHREAAAATFGGNNAPWWIAGGAMFVLILVVGWTMVRPAAPEAPAGMPPAGGTPADGQSSLDLNSMSPREAADRLFNRVMESMSQADTAGALFFQPMAVQAYQRAEPLDLDGLLHQSLLEALADPAGGLATAQRILESEPNHVLGLGAAAQAAIAMGDSAQASDYYRRLVGAYDAEYARNLVEYDGHRTLMAEMRSDAQAFLAASP